MLMPVAPNKHYNIGSLLVIDEYGRMDNPAQTAKPTHICAENAKANEKTEILVFPITSDMIFEAPILGNAQNIKIGTKLGFAYNEYNCAYTLTGSTSNGVATVVYNLDYETNGNKIRVRFE
jgi:hypothetical protein